MHLIQAHGYPKEYFFAVTNKGVGGLLKKWGEGASMIRRSWRARGDDEESEDLKTDNETPVTEQGRQKNISRLDDSPLVEDEKEEAEQDSVDAVPSVDNLTASMDTLFLVPPAIRFGRGAKRGGTCYYNVSHGIQQSRHTSTEQHSTAGSGIDVGPLSHVGRGGSGERRGVPHASQHDGLSLGHPPFMPRGIGARGRGRIFERGRIAVDLERGSRGGRIKML
jgi:hypothetical protein